MAGLDQKQGKTTSNLAELKVPQGVDPTLSSKELLKRGAPEALLNKLKTLPTEIAHVEWIIPKQKGRIARTLVDIREAHNRSFTKELFGQDVHDATLKVQKQLGQILSHFEHPTIYKDGMDQKTLDGIKGSFSDLAKHKQFATELEEMLDSKSLAKTNQSLMRLSQKDAPQKVMEAVTFLRDYQQLRAHVETSAREDTVYRLLRDGAIQVRPGEKTEFLEATLQLTDKNPTVRIDDPAYAELMRKRDTHHIETIGQTEDVVSFGVWGAGHSFAAEVKQWNKLHPDKLIAIVEVTPAEYRRSFENNIN